MMDKELEQLLISSNLKDVQTKLAENQVYSFMALKMVTDDQFEKMGISIGQAATARSLLAVTNKETAREQRIQNLVDQIHAQKASRQKAPGKTGRQRAKSAESHPKKQSNAPLRSKSIAKSLTVRVGWMHRNGSGAYKQFRMGGAGVRQLTFEADEVDAISPRIILDKALPLFFPGGYSTTVGNLCDLKTVLGNFSKEEITQFTTSTGQPCTYLGYLKDQGLFSSRVTFYVLTTKENKSAAQGGPNTEGAEGSQDEEHENAKEERMTASSLKLKVESDNPCPVGDLTLEYEEIMESSYSEVIIRSLSFSILQCYELQSTTDLFIKDTPLTEYCPLEHGPYGLRKVYKGDECFLDVISEPSCDNPEIEVCSYTFPQASDSEDGKIILHPPSQLWGYDGNRLIVAVVARCHGQASVRYIWYKDGLIIKQGASLCSTPIDEPGEYAVEIQYEDIKEVTEPFKVIADVVSPSAQTSPDGANSNDLTPQLPRFDGTSVHEHPTTLPVVEKEEITILSEIGRGSFGTVHKAVWVGTEVAVKVIRVRNAKRVSASFENEVAIHSLVRHPNIVQIMGVSFLKNSVYVISELIDGQNLDEILFGDDENKSMVLTDLIKLNICRHISQAMSYMHNLKQQILHRDIKPANVMVSKVSYVAKLCDMGLSKLKSNHSLTHTGLSVPGTPQYMAPECLVIKETATAASDIWSLACTVVECLTEEDLWGDELSEVNTASDQTAALTKILQKGEKPRVLQRLESGSTDVLSRCFNYDPLSRPTAVEVLESINQCDDFTG